MNKDKIIEKRNQIAAMLYQNMSKIDADGTLILVDELAQLKAEAEQEVSDEDIEKAFPTDLKVLAKTVKFPEMGLSYEAKEWFEARINDNLNRQIGAKAMRDGLIKKGV